MNNDEFVIRLKAQLDTTSQTVSDLNTQIKSLDYFMVKGRLRMQSRIRYRSI